MELETKSLLVECLDRITMLTNNGSLEAMIHEALLNDQTQLIILSDVQSKFYRINK